MDRKEETGVWFHCCPRKGLSFMDTRTVHPFRAVTEKMQGEKQIRRML